MKNLFKVLVCGSREVKDKEFIFAHLDNALANKNLEKVVIMHGDQMSIDSDTGEKFGADYIADQWAIERGVKRWRYPADWKQHGRAAGPIRNSRMLNDNPDACIAFFGKTAKNKGTSDMLSKCEKKGMLIKKYYI